MEPSDLAQNVIQETKSEAQNPFLGPKPFFKPNLHKAYKKYVHTFLSAYTSFVSWFKKKYYK